jgi:alpha-glucosidase
MNEASNFCEAECGYKPTMDNFPYTPGGADLNLKAIDLGAMHYNGNIEYDQHSLFGFMEAKITSEFFKTRLNRRPFIISRSSFVTHGQHASHWLGDNESKFEYLAWSIPGIFDFGMYGVPIVGADICGFNGKTFPEL